MRSGVIRYVLRPQRYRSSPDSQNGVGLKQFNPSAQTLGSIKNKTTGQKEPIKINKRTGKANLGKFFGKEDEFEIDELNNQDDSPSDDDSLDLGDNPIDLDGLKDWEDIELDGPGSDDGLSGGTGEAEGAESGGSGGSNKKTFKTSKNKRSGSGGGSSSGSGAGGGSGGSGGGGGSGGSGGGGGGDGSDADFADGESEGSGIRNKSGNTKNGKYNKSIKKLLSNNQKDKLEELVPELIKEYTTEIIGPSAVLLSSKITPLLRTVGLKHRLPIVFFRGETTRLGLEDEIDSNFSTHSIPLFKISQNSPVNFNSVISSTNYSDLISLAIPTSTSSSIIFSPGDFRTFNSIPIANVGFSDIVLSLVPETGAQGQVQSAHGEVQVNFALISTPNPIGSDLSLFFSLVNRLEFIEI